MIDLLVNNHRYRCPDRWEQMSWRQLDAGLRYQERRAKALSGEPDRTGAVRAFRDPDGTGHPGQTGPGRGTAETDALTAQLLSVACRMRPATARQTDPTDRALFAARYARLARRELKRLEAIPGRIFPSSNRRILRLLSGGTDFDGDPIPAHGMAAGAWCEASDLFLLDRWRYAPLIASLLCTPAGKVPCERTVRRRAERFRRLPVPAFDALFGRIERTHRMLRETYPLCYGKPASRTAHASGAAPASWTDLLMWTARHAPGEIARLRAMDCGGFLALAHSRIRMQR